MKSLKSAMSLGACAIAFLVGSLSMISATAAPIVVQATTEKQRVMQGFTVADAIGSFFWTPIFGLGTLAVNTAILLSNDIKVGTGGHAADANFASPVTASSLALTNAQTNAAGSPIAVNLAINNAVNSELQLASALLAAATASNRYFTALDNGDVTSATARQAEIRFFVDLIISQQQATAGRFEELADALQATGTDSFVDEIAFDAFQNNLAANGFAPEFIAIYQNQLLPNFDASLINSAPHFIDPIVFGFDQLSAIRFADINGGNPLRVSDALLQATQASRQVSSVVGPFAVPEPGTLLLLIVGMIGLLRKGLAHDNGNGAIVKAA